jgi:DNA-binding transcriptional MerR regulator
MKHPVLKFVKAKNTGKIYTMKEACEETGLPYETLKFYCKVGLIPNVRRDSRNRRVFNDKNISWIKSLTCLKNCDMTIAEMKEYLDLCLQGQSTIPKRKVMLTSKRADLVKKLAEVQAAIEYIDLKQEFYDEVLSGRIEYFSSFTPDEEE